MLYVDAALHVAVCPPSHPLLRLRASLPGACQAPTPARSGVWSDLNLQGWDAEQPAPAVLPVWDLFFFYVEFPLLGQPGADASPTYVTDATQDLHTPAGHRALAAQPPAHWIRPT